MEQTPKVRMRSLIKNSNVVVSPHQKIERYYLSGQQMYTVAKQLYNSKQYERAYFYYLRYMQLFLEEISKHPNFKEAPRMLKSEVKRNIAEMLPEAEEIKQILLKEYEAQYQVFLQNEGKKGSSIASVAQPMRNIIRKRYSLQDVTVPYSLIPTFLDLALSNTYKNIETCAFLTGVITDDYLSITTLLVSQQSGTSDECTAENDLATFNAMETNGLLTFGWIHTHPTQESFLSSVDLHTQYGYQSMLPEAIAIVCSPKHCNYVFRLTQAGMDVISTCKDRGFHTHSGPPLFAEAKHVIFVDDPTKVIDLR